MTKGAVPKPLAMGLQPGTTKYSLTQGRKTKQIACLQWVALAVSEALQPRSLGAGLGSARLQSRL